MVLILLTQNIHLSFDSEDLQIFCKIGITWLIRRISAGTLGPRPKEWPHVQPAGRGEAAQGANTMNAENDSNESMQWIEDLGGLGFDELRDLPFHVQAGMDIAVFE